jgi:hypothetical protein
MPISGSIVRLLAVLVLAVGTSAAAAATGAISAQTVEERIRRRGAARTLDELYATERTWSQVLRGVRSGNPAWLKVARTLKAEGGPSAPELTAALAEALAVAPERVLGLLGQEFDADDVCSLNTLEDTLGESYAAALGKVQARERAVRNVKAPALAAPREECLGFLEELAREVERNREAWFPKP